MQQLSHLELVRIFIAGGVSIPTARQYARQVQSAERVLGDLSITPLEDVCEYYRTLKPSRATRQTARSALIRYFEASRRPGLCEGLKSALKLPPKPRGACRALDEAKAYALSMLAASLGGPKGIAVLCGLYAGLRRAEICSLPWSAFDDEVEWMTITGKGDLRARIPVHPVLSSALVKHHVDSPWVFPGLRGHIAPYTVSTWVYELGERSGAGHVSPHMLRHTCLATANDLTGDLRAVQELARHARPETTALYTRATVKRLKFVVDSIDYGRAAL
jgi:integrase